MIKRTGKLTNTKAVNKIFIQLTPDVTKNVTFGNTFYDAPSFL